MDNDEVADFYRRLWRLPPAPARLGRRSILDVDAVVDTAIRLADEEGLDSATLPKVAKKLGVTPMSLYRHVGSKQELLLLMLDAASSPREAHEAASGWRDGLRLWAVDLWELYLERPWLPRVPVHRPPAGPHQMAWMERGLAQLSTTPLAWDLRLSVVTLLSGYVRHSALLAQELEEGLPAEHSHADSGDLYAQTLGSLITPGEFPHLSEMLASEALASTENTSAGEAYSDFGAGLDLILDGLAVRVDGRAPRSA